jgi:hypothetical protein
MEPLRYFPIDGHGGKKLPPLQPRSDAGAHASVVPAGTEYLVTTKIRGTDFWLSDSGTYTDIAARAKRFSGADAADRAAASEARQSGYVWTSRRGNDARVHRSNLLASRPQVQMVAKLGTGRRVRL